MRERFGSRFRAQCPLFTFVLLSCGVISGCGSGGSTPPPPPPPPTPDFGLTIQPSHVSVAQGSNGVFTVAVTGSNGFNSSVSISVSGMPIGVSGSPLQFSLNPGAQQAVTVEVTTTASVGQSNLTIAATSGSLNHSSEVAVAITTLQITANAPLRMNYVRTDAQWSVGYLNFAPQPWILYHPETKRFFVSNTAVNRVDVFDATTETKIGEITVPAAWSADLSLDHSTIYMGTQIGDLYQIDPVRMAITNRIPSVQIGPNGFAANVARVMADGRLALFGYPFAYYPGGLPFIDGYAQLIIWNPAGNSVQVHGGAAEMTLTADRKKVILFTIGSPADLILYDPVAGTDTILQVEQGSTAALQPPDGKEMIVPFGAVVTVYDSSTLAQLDQFQVGDGQQGYSYILSLDGNTLFAISRITNQAFAVDWRTHQLKGWLGNFGVQDVLSGVTPMAIDETNLIAGTIGHGLAFLDGSVLLPAEPHQEMSICCYPLQPTFGPAQGGTAVQETGVAPTLNLAGIYFGVQPATQVSAGPQYWYATTPPNTPGPVNVRVAGTDGGLLMLPEAYSYGPFIVELTTAATTAEGGATATIYGYGFDGVQNDGTGSGLTILVGGQQAAITKFSGQGYVPAPGLYPFPLESMQFTIPPHTSGTLADITVSNNAGTTTQSQELRYLPAAQVFPLPGASLAQGVYDATRGLYYFTDRTQIQIFSRTQGTWLPPVSVKNATRLWGLALSPDGSKLAVGDAGASVIYVLDPASLATQTSFSLPATVNEPDQRPSGLVITDAGIVYYDNFYPGLALHKVDTNTGIVTNISNLGSGLVGNDAYVRMALTRDNGIVLFNLGSGPYALDTANDSVSINNALFNQGDYELALASNQTRITAAEYLMTTSQSAESFVSLNEREVWNESAVYGEKLSPDGSLLFRPLTDAIDVVDGRTGVLLSRIALATNLSPIYDALVEDGIDNILVAITGQNGDGIAVIDLSSIPQPSPLPYVAQARSSATMAPANVTEAPAPKLFETPEGLPAQPAVNGNLIPHVQKSLFFRDKTRRPAK